MVRDSKLVFLHASTSQSFAVIWRKPIVFLTSDALKSSWIGPIIQNHAVVLNTVEANISQTEGLKNTDSWFQVDEMCYKNYQDQYIKVAGSAEKKSWELFVDFIEEADI